MKKMVVIGSALLSFSALADVRNSMNCVSSGPNIGLSSAFFGKVLDRKMYLINPDDRSSKEIPNTTCFYEGEYLVCENYDYSLKIDISNVLVKRNWLDLLNPHRYFKAEIVSKGILWDRSRKADCII